MALRETQRTSPGHQRKNAEASINFGSNLSVSCIDTVHEQYRIDMYWYESYDMCDVPSVTLEVFFTASDHSTAQLLIVCKRAGPVSAGD